MLSDRRVAAAAEPDVGLAAVSGSGASSKAIDHHRRDSRVRERRSAVVKERISYFVTGATGFIGRNLVEQLLEREGTVFVLVREGSKGRLEELRNRWGVDEHRVVGISGDLSERCLGVSEDDLGRLRGRVDHLFHLAAIYDMTADAESQRIANVEGTRHMVEFAHTVGAGCVHMVSSIAAAGLYRGTWREDMFEEARGPRPPLLPHQARVRGRRAPRARRPWRVYRPGIVVGNSETGEMDKVDGPYYFFKLIRRIRNTVRNGCRCPASKVARSTSCRSTSWSGRWTTSPTSRASTDGPSAHRSQAPERRRGDRHLRPRRSRAQVLSEAAGRRGRGARAAGADGRLGGAARARRSPIGCSRTCGIPRSVLVYVNYPTRFDSRQRRGGARGDRYPGAAAGGLRLAAVGLLGAAPRPGPVPRPSPSGRRARGLG